MSPRRPGAELVDAVHGQRHVLIHIDESGTPQWRIHGEVSAEEADIIRDVVLEEFPPGGPKS